MAEVAVSAEAPADLVASWFARDGVRRPGEALTAATAAACAAGVPAACALAPVAPGDHAGAATALAAVCRSGDPAGDPLACLGLAWSMLPALDSGVDPGSPSDPARYRALVEAACAAGLPRGCTEQGYVHALGVATYRDPSHGHALWLAGCEGGEAHACTALGRAAGLEAALERGFALGDASAEVDLALRGPDADRDARLLHACGVGVTRGCFESVARLDDPTRAADVLRQACALGDPPSCVLAILGDAESGALAVDQAVTELGRYCPTVRTACEEVAFLRQGAPPIAAYRGDPGGRPEIDLRAHLFDLVEPLHQCTLRALRAGDPLPPRAVWRVGEGGVVGAVEVQGVSPEVARCAAKVVLAHRFREPLGGTQRVEGLLPLYHRAVVRLSSTSEVSDAGPDLARVQVDADERWGVGLDECVLRHGTPETGVRMDVSLTVGRTGRISEVRVERPTGEPAVDACATAWLEEHVVREPPTLRTPARAEIRFLEPTPTDPGTPPPAIHHDPPQVLPPPVTVRALALVAARSTVDGRPGRLTRRSIESVRQAHADLAEYVEAQTHGVVRIEWTVEVVSERLVVAAADRGLDRWNVGPAELPDAVLDRVVPGRYDSVFLWWPIPAGFPSPALGVTYPGASVGGATFSSVPLTHRGRVHANSGVPPFGLPLHEWWHQMEDRAGRLGVAVPDNHAVLSVSGVRLDPRGWFGSATVMRWYDEVLGWQVHPELWGRAWAADLAARPPNLALRSDAPEVLVDGLDSDGGFGLGVPLGEDPLLVTWSAPVTIGQVVVHLAADPGISGETRLKVVIGGAAVPGGDVALGRRESVAIPVAQTTDALEIWAATELPPGVRITELEVLP